MASEINLIHCSYHKCLTVYYQRVIGRLYNGIMRWSNGYRHFNSNVDDFYQEIGEHRVASVNNQKLDFTRLGNYRISRFLRDPRDLVVSGFFYHRKGIEPWSRIVGPTPEQWMIVNGNIPKGMGAKHSFSSYLQELDQESGLIAEIEFRKNHFQSMMEWPENDPRIRTFRYENILGNEKQTFRDILQFYRLPLIGREIGAFLARRYSAKQRGKSSQHIRNPSAGQWRKHFTQRVNSYFNERYTELLIKLDYPLR